MKKILIVNDNRTIPDSVRAVMGSTYAIIEVASGVQALEYLKEEVCDLIILDTGMPENDSFAVMRSIRDEEVLSRIPVIFLSEDKDEKIEKRCLEEGAMDFILKPFAPEVLRLRVGRILETVEQQRRLTDRLEKKIKEVDDMTNKSNQDALTGLWNRSYVEKKVNEHIQNGIEGALFMIDVDNFKEVNDKYGHIEGDLTLKMFANTLKNAKSEGDIISRIGGDEFIMFISGHKTKEELKKTAGGIISDICRNIQSKEYDSNVSVSIGIAQIPEDGESFEAVYSAADKALYHVKQNGKSSYYFYSEQKSAEDARTKNVVDLKYLYAIMGRGDSGVGAYQLDLNSFHHVYHFIHRFVARSRRDVQLVLFTLVPAADAAQDEVDDALEVLDQAIYTSLRRTDVSTRYSRRQVLVILVDTSTSNVAYVTGRILECFEKTNSHSNVDITYEITKIEGENFLGAAYLPENQEKHILVAGDNEASLTAIRQALAEVCADVETVSFAQAADCLEERRYDLIMLDSKCSQAPGLMEKIREQYASGQAPVIFLAENQDLGL